MLSNPSLVKGFGSTSFIPAKISHGGKAKAVFAKLTVLEVHRNVVTSNVGGHCDNGRVVELADEVSRRNTIQVRHNDVHENQVILCPVVHFINGF
jgi:hypothetical protein